MEEKECVSTGGYKADLAPTKVVSEAFNSSFLNSGSKHSTERLSSTNYQSTTHFSTVIQMIAPTGTSLVPSATSIFAM